jgi:hypothetical protein
VKLGGFSLGMDARGRRRGARAPARTWRIANRDCARPILVKMGKRVPGFSSPLLRAPNRVRRIFDSDLVEEVFATHELAFDAEALRMTMRRRLADASIPMEFGVSANRIRRAADRSSLQVECSSKEQNFVLSASWVFNCTYSRINQLTVASNLEPVTLKHELTELALVEMPPSLRGISVTVMCGPFFSTMPFPPRGLWTLSHVRYTPHCSWTDSRLDAHYDAYLRLEGFRKSSSFPYMVRDASRYLPALKDCVYRDSLWEVKTTLPQSELDSMPRHRAAGALRAPERIREKGFRLLAEGSGRTVRPPPKFCGSNQGRSCQDRGRR